jgi:mono/diheme cytochrome c family protein
MMKLFGLSLAYGLACSAAQGDAVSYGKYLVEEVAKCGDCHTPRKATGEFDEEKRLKGAPLDAPANCDVKNWAKVAPDLTSSGRLFSKWGERGMMKYLETGLNPQGTTSHPPMPAYKLRPHDAEAIVAYLRTLK